jgi:hypothetical protein
MAELAQGVVRDSLVLETTGQAMRQLLTLKKMWDQMTAPIWTLLGTDLEALRTTLREMEQRVEQIGQRLDGMAGRGAAGAASETA